MSFFVAWGSAQEGGLFMELIPYRLFGELSPFRKEMDRLWNRFLGETSFGKTFAETWSPSVDISETKDNFVVKAELPGLEAKDVNVSISGDVLTVKGEKNAEEEEKDEHYHRIERYSGSFQRVFQLPSGVKADKVKATFDKGVLKITLPKVEEAKKKEIEVKIK
jgi:HSP20 family protein